MLIRSLDEKELEAEEFANTSGEALDPIFPQSKRDSPCAGASSKIGTPVRFTT